MSDNRGPSAKGRWERARGVATALDIGVKTAWISLKALEDNDLVDPVLEGIEEAIDIAREMLVEPRNKTFKANAQDVKLMMWAFNKIGDLSRCEKAYKKCVMVCE